MGACHGPQVDGLLGPHCSGQRGLITQTCGGGCCAGGGGDGASLPGGAYSSAFCCRSRQDIDLDLSSPVKCKIDDAHADVLQGFSCCSPNSRRIGAASATTACASGPPGVFTVSDSDKPARPYLVKSLFADLTPGDFADTAPVAPHRVSLGGIDDCPGRDLQKADGLQGSTEAWHGAGVLSWPDGRKYVGQFCKGAFDGDATMVWPDGRKYIGQYRENKKHGEGEFIWPDGRLYTGQWSNGQRHGHGIYTNAKGEQRAGKWSQDRPVSWEGDIVIVKMKAEEKVNLASTKIVGKGDALNRAVAPSLGGA